LTAFRLTLGLDLLCARTRLLGPSRDRRRGGEKTEEDYPASGAHWNHEKCPARPTPVTRTEEEVLLHARFAATSLTFIRYSIGPKGFIPRPCGLPPVPATREGFREATIVRVCILASSSAGNAAFLSSGSTRLLIDAGLSRKAIVERLRNIGEDPEALDGVLLTHEHADHISGLNVLLRNLKRRTVPVYVTHLTATAIEWNDCAPELREFQAGSRFTIGDIEVQSFTTPHDAVDPVGFCFRIGGLKAGIVTDLGYIPASVKHHLRDIDFLLLEANHDIEMLKVGPYPWQVKQRVMSRKGHLSNDVVAEFIAHDLGDSTRTLVLGHLSEHNNHPEIVRMTALEALDRRGLEPRLVVAEPRRQTELFEFD